MRRNPPKRKIAIVNVFFAPQAIGGATRVVIDNVSVLKERYREEFELVFFTSELHQLNAPHRLNVYNYKGSRVYRASALFRPHMDWFPRDDEMGELFGQFLDVERPDIVHFHCIQRLTGSIVEACLERRIPYFITLHDAWWISDYQFLVDEEGRVYPDAHPDIDEEITTPKGISLEASKERRRYLGRLLRKASKLFSVSESFAELYRKNGIDNIVTIPNGISSDMKWEKKQTGYTQRVVGGHIGGMSEHKGYDLLKQAVLDVQPEHMEFLIVDHSKSPEYHLHDHWGSVPVTYIGRIPQDEIARLYGKIDVLFAPSIWPESFGLVTREAAACGCWVVASKLGGIGEDVVDGETGFVIEPTEEALTRVIKEIDAHPERYKESAPTKEVRYVDQQVEELVHWYEEKE